MPGRHCRTASAAAVLVRTACRARCWDVESVSHVSVLTDMLRSFARVWPAAPTCSRALVPACGPHEQAGVRPARPELLLTRRTASASGARSLGSGSTRPDSLLRVVVTENFSTTTGAHPFYLPLSEGDIVHVTDRYDDGSLWWRGYREDDPDKTVKRFPCDVMRSLPVSLMTPEELMTLGSMTADEHEARSPSSLVQRQGADILTAETPAETPAETLIRPWIY